MFFLFSVNFKGIIIVYNIYNRAKNIFCNENENFKFWDDKAEGLRVMFALENNTIDLFDFNCRKNRDDYKKMNIGKVSLFQTIGSSELREEELDRVMKKLDELYAETNPYHQDPGYIGGPASNWYFEHQNMIRDYEQKFKELDSKKELTDSEKREIEITEKYHTLLLEDYGLTDESFAEEKYEFLGLGVEKSKLEKTLIKKMPNLVIENNIKYI